jgi:VWFA-related protein
MQEIKLERAKPPEAKLAAAQSVTFSFDRSDAPTSSEASQQAQQLLQNLREKNQIAEAEAEPESTCAGCEASNSPTPTEAKVASGPIPSSKSLRINSVSVTTLRASVDEVAVFFTATDHGKSVTDLTGADVGIRDDRKAPAAILGFRNEAQLPLRLGLVIDTSSSIASRFSFEQHAAVNFLQKAVTNKDDLGFVVGVANSILVVQDFTSDQKMIARAVDQLVPSGGTALWDAVAFAADKLAARPEVQHVAKVLVVISDGEDNSSSISLKEAIRRAQHGEVAIYTVSTRDYGQEAASALLGDHALRTLAELTGGATFTPGSARRLNGSLADLQQVLRGRYLISYKPALFQRDGSYRTIDITAQKDGHRLRVYARKGYYASTSTPAPDHD